MKLSTLMVLTEIIVMCNFTVGATVALFFRNLVVAVLFSTVVVLVGCGTLRWLLCRVVGKTWKEIKDEEV